MDSSSLKWNNDLIFKLIDLYRERPALWDTTCEEFKDRDKKHSAWCEIASSMETNKETVQRKMKTLITQFRRELYKTTNDSIEDIKWFAFKRLKFLDSKLIYTNRRTFSENVQVIQENNLKELPEITIKNEEESEDDLQIPTRKEELLLMDNQSNFEESTCSNNSLYSNRERNCHRNNSNSYQSYNSNKEINVEKRTHDEYSLFGEVVAMKLKKIENRFARSTAQFHINNILYKAEIGEYDN